MGRWCTMLGVLVSIGTAYLVMQFSSIMDYVQALFSFFIAPLFGTVLLGMLWKRATPAGGFWGLLAGHRGLFHWSVALGEARIPARCATWRFLRRQGHGGEHVPRAVVLAGLRGGDRGRQPDDQAQAREGTDGLVYGVTDIPSSRQVLALSSPGVLGGGDRRDFVILNIIFW